MTIKLSTSFNNPALPLATPLGQQILGFSSLYSWAQADAATTAISSGTSIASFVDRRPGAVGWAQPAAGRQAALTPAQIGGYAAAVFDGVDDHYSHPDPDFDFTQPFTIIALLNGSAAGGADMQVMSRFNDLANRTYVNIRPSSVDFLHGSGMATLPYARGTWGLVIAASNQTQLKMRINGVSAAPAATNNAAGTNQWSLGSLYDGTIQQPFRGAIADVLVFSEDIIANAARLSLVEKYFVNTYGLSFTPA